MKTMKKYNIGSPKRPGKTKSKTVTRTIYKKYKIGPPAKVIVTPDTPKSKIWKKIRKERNDIDHDISDYEPDEDDEGFESESTFQPTFKSIFEPTKYTKHALQKKPFTRSHTEESMDYDIDKAWINKTDNSPSRNRPSRTKGRSRGRSRGRGRRNRG
jgi:hypothetical protein